MSAIRSLLHPGCTRQPGITGHHSQQKQTRGLSSEQTDEGSVPCAQLMHHGRSARAPGRHLDYQSRAPKRSVPCATCPVPCAKPASPVRQNGQSRAPNMSCVCTCANLVSSCSCTCISATRCLRFAVRDTPCSCHICPAGSSEL